MAAIDEDDTGVVGAFVQPLDAVKQYSMMRWYKSIEEHTLKSRMIPLDEPTAAALRKLCKAELMKSTPSTETSSCNSTADSPAAETERDILHQLEEQIATAILEFKGSAFVKLCTRSPKDAVYEAKNDRVSSLLKPALFELHTNTHPTPVSKNDAAITFFRCCNSAMQVHSGAEALQLLSRSDRIAQDLSAFQNDPSNELFLVIREWTPLPLESEYRGFVCQGRFTALSQYYHFLYFPSIVEQKEITQRKILAFWEHVKSSMPFESYVIDFAVTAEKIFIIELNPFVLTKPDSAPFFSWKKGSPDRSILCNGPFTFRVRTEPDDSAISDHLVPYWEKFIQATLEEAAKSAAPSCYIC